VKCTEQKTEQQIIFVFIKIIPCIHFSTLII